MVTVIKADKSHIPQIVPLFDQYRKFYEQGSDLKAAYNFLEERILRNQSIIFLAFYMKKPVGFTQLYKTFSSVSLQPFFILNDLYVVDGYRKKGIGEALLNEAKEYCKAKGYKGLALETSIDNPAQQLYERLDWKKDSNCFHYFWTAD